MAGVLPSEDTLVGGRKLLHFCRRNYACVPHESISSAHRCTTSRLRRHPLRILPGRCLSASRGRSEVSWCTGFDAHPAPLASKPDKQNAPTAARETEIDLSEQKHMCKHGRAGACKRRVHIRICGRAQGKRQEEDTLACASASCMLSISLCHSPSPPQAPLLSLFRSPSIYFRFSLLLWDDTYTTEGGGGGREEEGREPDIVVDLADPEWCFGQSISSYHLFKSQTEVFSPDLALVL